MMEDGSKEEDDEEVDAGNDIHKRKGLESQERKEDWVVEEEK